MTIPARFAKWGLGLFYSPVAAGKNAWLLGQALFIAVYFSGAVLAFGATRRTLNHVDAV